MSESSELIRESVGAGVRVKPRVLLVDDEKNILSSLRRLLKTEGYELILAQSGEEALDIITRTHVDLVVSDMRMPGMTGAELLQNVAREVPDSVRILLTGYADLTSTIEAINSGGIYRYISKPWEDHDLKLTIRSALDAKFMEADRKRLQILTQSQNEKLVDLNDRLEEKVKERTAELAKSMSELGEMHEALKSSYSSSIKIFASLIDLRDTRTAGHSRRVANVAREIAVEMKLNADQIKNILFAALLHDIGKMGLSDRLLESSFNALSREEKNRVTKHPILGEAALMALEPLHEAANIIRSHHERYDGQGYPDQLKGNEIPLAARIIAVANEYDGVQIGLVSTQRLSAKQAVDYIKENKAKRFDPKVVDAFLKLYGDEEKKVVSASGFIAMDVADLKPKMILAKELLTKGGVLLLPKGHVLDYKTIVRIESLERSLGSPLKVHILPKYAK